MKRTCMTGHTCVGDLRLCALDVGFDLRAIGTAIKLPAEFSSVGLDDEGETYLIEGSRDEMVAAILRAGYTIDHGQASQ